MLFRSKSPARGLNKPKGTSGSHRAITDEERRVILKVAKTHKHGLWVKLMLFCGLRTGETARVKVCHFDFEKKLLFIVELKRPMLSVWSRFLMKSCRR